MAEASAQIRKIAPVIQELVDRAIAADGNAPVPESRFDQVNLTNGVAVVLDHLDHNEAGLALDHLDYMIEETGVTLPGHIARALAEIRARLT